MDALEHDFSLESSISPSNLPCSKCGTLCFRVVFGCVWYVMFGIREGTGPFLNFQLGFRNLFCNVDVT